MLARPSPPERPRALRIGCCPIPLQRLQSFLGALQVKASCVRAEVLHLATAEQIKRLRAGELDLGVIDYAIPGPPLEVQPLYAGEPVAALLPIGHRLAACRVVRPGDLTGETWISSPRAANAAFHDALDTALAATGHLVSHRRETGGSDPDDVLLAVAEGHGIAVAPLSSLGRAGELGELLTGRLFDPPVHLPDTLLAWRADPPYAPAEAIAAARSAASELHAAFSAQR